jgi:class 3 adenylate cyclase
MTISTWLESIGLAQYAGAFEANDIGFGLLPELTSEDLREIGVNSIGHRRKILAAAERLDAPAPSNPPSSNEAERRHLTVLFSDLVGSTQLSSELDPEEMREVIGHYQNAVEVAIADVEGYVAQYMGDGVVAYFGYPVAHERGAERAVSAGLAIVDAVSRLMAPNGQPLSARVGIATGHVVVGDLLTHGNQEVHNVVGDTPNIAARLQGYGNPGEVIIAADTKRLIEGRFECESRGAAELKGLPEAVEIWRVGGPAAPVTSAQKGRNLNPLIGRDPEMQLLSGCWRNALDGQPQLVYLRGEPGIGKSRVMEQIVENARAEGGLVRRLYCSPFFTSSAYYPIVSYIERAAGFDRLDATASKLEKLDAILAERHFAPDTYGALLAQLLSLPTDDRYPPLDLAPTALRGRTFEVLTELLLGKDPDQPVLIALEDAHWMDPTTTDFWAHLTVFSEGRPVVLVMTHRADFQPSKSAGPLRRTDVEIDRLTDSQGRQLIEAMLGGKSLPPQVTERIIEKSDGNPLFLEELSKTVIAGDSMRDAGTHYELSRSLDEVLIPDTLQDSLMSRLDSLSGVKVLTQVASVIGRRFSRSLLVALDLMPPERLDMSLYTLIDAELIFSTGAAENPTYTFKHALIRDAAYESILRRRRMSLHAQIAEVLEVQGGEGSEGDPALVARHFSLAGLPDKAVPFWLQAGKRSMQNSAMAEALDHLTHGLEQATEITDLTLRKHLEYSLKMSMGFCYISLQGWQAPLVGENLNAAYELGADLGERESMLPVMYGLWIHWLNRADFAESQRWIDLAEKDFGADGSEDWRLIISTMEVIQHRWGGTHQGVSDNSAEVLELYDPEKHGHFVYMFGNDPKVVTEGFKSWTSWITGDPDLAEQERVACRESSIAVNHPFDRAWQLMVGALTAYFSGQRDVFAASVAEAVALGDRQSVPFVQFILGPVWTGLVHLMDEEWDAAIDIMPRGIEAWEQMGGGVALPFWKSSLGYAMARHGQVDDGRALIKAGIDIAERTGEYWFTPEAYRLLAAVLLLGDQPDHKAARMALEQAIALARLQGAAAWEERAASDLAALEGVD